MTEVQIWQNAFYYALSTIAQTLAAAFGILATFMLFRFEHAEGKIKSHGEDISESVSTLDASVTSNDLVARLKEGDAEAVEQVVGEVKANVSKGRKGKRSDLLCLDPALEDHHVVGQNSQSHITLAAGGGLSG